MAKGSDAVLQRLAEREIAVPTQSADQIALADGWWDLAEKEKSPLRKGPMQTHARVLYDGALAGATGIARVKVERRLEQLEIATAGPVNLLRMIDPKSDAVLGQWKIENGVLTCAPLPLARLQVPYQPPEEYDLTVVVSRRSGADAILVGLVGGGVQFAVSIDTFSGQGGSTFLDSFDGNVAIDRNPTLVRGIQIAASSSATLVCSVRKKGVSVTLNGRRIIAWEGEYRHLSTNPPWKVPEPRALFIGAYDVGLQFGKYSLTPVTGQGKKLR